MFEQLVLGIIQGVTEWLPISSEGMVMLAKTTFFYDGSGLSLLIKQAVFLHLGTFFAALVYLRKDVVHLLQASLRYKEAAEETKLLLRFLLVATLITGIVGFGIFQVISQLENVAVVTGTSIAILVGLMLCFTGFMQIRAQKNIRQRKAIQRWDTGLLGLVQGLSALPGLSRSGITISAFLLRGFDKTFALRTSFLLSLPVILGGNVFLYLDGLSWDFASLIGLLASFGAGLLTIHLLFRVAERVNFGYFALGFGFLTLVFALI